MIKSGKVDKSMKKGYIYVSLFSIVLTITGVFLIYNLRKFSMKRDLQARNMIVIWGERELKGAGINNVTKLYQCNFGGEKYECYDIIDVTEWDIIAPIDRGDSFRLLAPKNYLSLFDFIG